MPDDIIKPNQPTNPQDTDGDENKPEATSIDANETNEAPNSTQPDTNSIDEPVSPPPEPPQEETVEKNNPTNEAPVSPLAVPVNPAPNTDTPRKRGPKIWLLILAMLVIAAISAAAAILIAKSGDSEQTTTTSNAKKDIAHLRYALPDGTLNQFYPTGNTATSVQLNSQIFEGLVRYDQQTKIAPLLATNWTNPDTSTWVFNLRKDVKFHNDKPMTAKDVKYSLDYAVAHMDDDNTNLFIASSIKQVDVANDYQVKITTDGPDPILLNRLAYLYIMSSDGTIGDPATGTGPYVVKPNTTPSETNIELIAYDKYYGGHIYTKAISLAIVPNSDQMIADINSGKYDLAGSLEPNELAKIKGYEPIKGQNFSIGFVGLNTLRSNSPLSTKEGREAVAYALDTPKILKAGNLGGEPTGQLIPPKIPGYDSSIQSTAYNPAKAKELLKNVPNASMQLTLSYGGGEDNKAHMTEMANELKAVGFNINLVEEPDLDTLVTKAFGGETDMFYIVYDSPTLDGYDVLSTILQGNDIYENEEISSQIDETASILDPTERLTLLKKISKEIADEKPVIPLYVPTDVFALKKPYFIQTDIPGGQAGVYFWQTYQK